MWNEGNGGFAGISGGINYPAASPGINEFLFDSVGVTAGAGDHYLIYINVTFGPQAWAADGNG